MYDLLKGVRVVEGAAFIAGPSCALHLAQMGAEVIRFDAIGGGPDFGDGRSRQEGIPYTGKASTNAKNPSRSTLGAPKAAHLPLLWRLHLEKTPAFLSPTIRRTGSSLTRRSNLRVQISFAYGSWVGPTVRRRLTIQ